MTQFFQQINDIKGGGAVIEKTEETKFKCILWSCFNTDLDQPFTETFLKQLEKLGIRWY